VGALAIFTTRSLAPRTENVMLSAAAGVMLAASFFSLLHSAIDLATDQLGDPVAGVLLSAGYARITAFLVASLTGLVEPVGGVVGGAAVWLAELLLAPVLAMAAGAVIFIISDEIIPETHRSGTQQVSTLSLMSGFALMMMLNAALGGVGARRRPPDIVSGFSAQERRDA